MRLFLLTITLLLLTACSNSLDKYVGYWKMNNDSDSIILLKISKADNSTYIVNQDILSDHKDLVLTEANGNLVVSTGFGQFPLVISEDGQTLRVEGRSYSKVDNQVAEEIEKNNTNCNVLRDQYLDELKKNKDYSNNGIDQLKDKYKTLQIAIPDCDLANKIIFF